MISENWIRFLDAKGRMVVDQAPVEETRLLLKRMHESAIKKLEYFFSQKDLRVRAMAKAYDLELEGTMRRHVSDEEVSAMHRDLTAKYGFSSLDSTPEAVAKRVLKRGALKDENEGRIIREILSNTRIELPTDHLKRLEIIVGQFERGASD